MASFNILIALAARGVVTLHESTGIPGIKGAWVCSFQPNDFGEEIRESSEDAGTCIQRVYDRVFLGVGERS